MPRMRRPDLCMKVRKVRHELEDLMEEPYAREYLFALDEFKHFALVVGFLTRYEKDIRGDRI